MKTIVTASLCDSHARQLLFASALRTLYCWAIVVSVLWAFGRLDSAGAGPDAIMSWLLDYDERKAHGFLAQLTLGTGFWGASGACAFGLVLASWARISMTELTDCLMHIPRMLVVCCWCGAILWASALLVVQALYSRIMVPTFYESAASYGLGSPLFLGLALCAFALFDSPIRD